MTGSFTPLRPPERPLSFGPLQLIPGKKGGRYPYCHSLVLAGEETWVVDPASDRKLLLALAKTGRVTRVFLSHFHEDHLKYAYLFPQAVFQVPAGEVEAFVSVEGIFRLAGVETPEFQAYLRETLARDFHFAPFPHLAPYHPGDRFVMGEAVLEVMAAPGHTPGHSCFAFPQQEVIYLADVDLTPFGPWYGDAASNLEDYLKTLVLLKKTSAQTYLTAHEQGVFSREEAQAGFDYFLQVAAARDDQILDLLTKPRTLEDLVAAHPIYRRAREPHFVYDHMERQMLTKHLERLARGGRVALTPQGYRALA